MSEQPSESNSKTSSSEKEKFEFPDNFTEFFKLYPGAKDVLMKVAFGITSTAVKLASKATEVQSKVEKALTGASERSKLMKETGEYIRDLREVAGMTVKDLSDALKLPDQSLLSAVEKGTSTLTFELILRLAALLARHDPIPFIIRLTRTYNPEIWSVLEDWGIGKIPVHFERERQFINIYRSQDIARKLSDQAFRKVIEFTQAAFTMAIHFASQSFSESDTSQKPPDQTTDSNAS